MIKPIAHLVVCGVVAGTYLMSGLKLVAADEGPSTSSGAAVSTTQRGGEPSGITPEALGITFVEGSTSTVIVARDGKRYTIDLASHKIAELESSPSPPASTPPQPPDPPSAGSQQMAATPAPKKEKPKVYEPGDDSVFSLPTGRRLVRHGFYVNFSHRFAFDPAFVGRERGGSLFGLDGFALASFGFRYGVTDKFSVSAYRSPGVLGRPIQLMAAYNFTDEHDGQPLNTAFRISLEGQNNFSKNFTTNFEGIFSRSITSRAQIYFVPTVSLHKRPLFGVNTPLPPSDLPCSIPGHCSNSFSLGVAGALDIRPTVALIAEVNPTLIGGRELGIHRPAYSFGIQKKIWRHSFTLGFTNSPGTTVSQRSGTVATFYGGPSADTPGGLFIGFDLTRQIY